MMSEEPSSGEGPRKRGIYRDLILASASPRRRELLATILAMPFEVVPAPVEEHEAHDADPRALVSHNAALKADWVAARHREEYVLGADTTVCVDNVVLNKPADENDARRMLRLLAGRTHSVFTAVALRHVRRRLRDDVLVESRVTFHPLDDAAIDAYLGAARPFDKAGAYGIQDSGEMIVARWEGSFTNIVGLPVEATRELLTRHGLPTVSPSDEAKS